jgi:cytidyltransferase-like protein
MRLVFTAAVMDLFHEGHINLLKEMRKEGDLVLVVLHDGFTTFKNKGKLPIESLEKRTRNLIDSGLVDIVRYTFEEEPNETFKNIIKDYGDKFELLFMRADDWHNFPGKETIDNYHIEIKFVSYTKCVSSTKMKGILNKEIKNNPVVENFREKAHLDIRDIDKVLMDNGIEYFLTAGTMLGAVRERDFIQYDWDIDICSMGFPEPEVRLKIQSDFRLLGFSVEADEGSESGRLRLNRNVNTDIHFFKKEGRLAMCRVVYDKPLFSIPLKYIELHKAKLGDYEYNVISEEYLDSVYRDWKTPMKDNYFKDDYYYFEEQ